MIQPGLAKLSQCLLSSDGNIQVGHPLTIGDIMNGGFIHEESELKIYGQQTVLRGTLGVRHI